MSAADRIRRQLERLAHLRGLGPVASDQARWIDQTRYLLIGLFGESSAKADSFLRGVGAVPADREEQAFTFNLPLGHPGPLGTRRGRPQGDPQPLRGK